MRNQFIQYLSTWAKEDKNIYLLTGDLGFGVLEPFAKAFPKRFINVGIAEQTMIGIAAGLSLVGKRVFVYSIVNFGTLRCLEQIRNDLCYHNANVVVTIVGASLAYGVSGYTHLGVEDLSSMLALPKLTVLSPADNAELEACMNYLKKQAGPVYLRLAKGGEPVLHQEGFDIETHVFKKLSSSVNIICHGTILSEVLKAQLLLKEQYYRKVGVFSVPLLKPFPEDRCIHILKRSTHIFIVEEHVSVGGLSAIISTLAARLGKYSPFVYSYGVDERVLSLIGRENLLRSTFGLDAKRLAKSIFNQLANPASLDDALVEADGFCAVTENPRGSK